jgi:hypothetical protein
MVLSRLSLHKHIRCLQDPRLNRRKRHLLGDILTIAVCAVLAGANTWPDSETFGRTRLPGCQRRWRVALVMGQLPRGGVVQEPKQLRRRTAASVA